MESRELNNEFEDFLQQAQQVHRDSLASMQTTSSMKEQQDVSSLLMDTNIDCWDEIVKQPQEQRLSLVQLQDKDQTKQELIEQAELTKYYATNKVQSVKSNEQQLCRQEGWLLKKSDKANAYREVYVVIEDRKLRYYADRQLKLQKGVIDFDLVPLIFKVENQAPPTTFQLIVQMVNNKTKVFQFRAQNANMCSKWCQTITTHYASSIMGQIQHKGIQQPPPVGLNFWKIAWISNQELIDHAQTGDILLFSGKSIASRLVRVVTSSSYDHVAMIVKFPKTGQIVLFESLQGNGVCRWDWRTFCEKNWHLNYNKIAYRRLLGVERDQWFRDQVTEFMVDTIGRPYRCDVSKLMEKTDIHNNKQAKQQVKPTAIIKTPVVNNSKKEGFFCSELIVCLYKKLGLVQEDAVPAHYYPGSFAQEIAGASKEVPLLDDAFFAEELSIDLANIKTD